MIVINKKEDYPVIYLRYLNNEIMYIGESISHINGRPYRDGLEENIGDYDKVILLKASKNKDRRRYWEAFLVCKLKPKKQRMLKYEGLLKNTKQNKKKKPSNARDNSDLRVIYKQEAFRYLEISQYFLKKSERI
jgi:hypothetical protein